MPPRSVRAQAAVFVSCMFAQNRIVPLLIPLVNVAKIWEKEHFFQHYESYIKRDYWELCCQSEAKLRVCRKIPEKNVPGKGVKVFVLYWDSPLDGRTIFKSSLHGNKWSGWDKSTTIRHLTALTFQCNFILYFENRIPTNGTQSSNKITSSLNKDSMIMKN